MRVILGVSSLRLILPWRMSANQRSVNASTGECVRGRLARWRVGICSISRRV